MEKYAVYAHTCEYGHAEAGCNQGTSGCGLYGCAVAGLDESKHVSKQCNKVAGKEMIHDELKFEGWRENREMEEKAT